MSIENVTNKTMNITPNKRKRECSVAAVNKENYGYNHHGGMEVKSLADLLGLPSQHHPTNPFEVVRKPPKKRTKCDNVPPADHNCFVNPALNLNGPENVMVNPFEIRRTSTDAMAAVDPHCFYNTGLNIRGPEKEVRNPFEIVRPAQVNEGNWGRLYDLLKRKD